jgi:TPR repeat protein
MRTRVLLLTVICLAAATSFAFDVKESIDRAVEQLDAHRYGLARAYLDPVVIDERAPADKRAYAYYLRGGSFSSEGLYVSAARDYESALDLWPDYPAALADLGQLYASGFGVKKNLSRAFRLMQKAARGGDENAKLYVGYAWLNGRGTPANTTKARYWLREAVAAGRVEALTQLAESYRAPFADEPDPTQAIALYQQASDKGSVDALVGLGYMYIGTETGTADQKRAVDYFTQAAKQGSPAGQTALGYSYLYGTGVARDYALAREWLERATSMNFPPAYAGLAYLYAAGLGIQANVARAKELYLQGAMLGDLRAQLSLANLELKPPTTEARCETALRWLRAAAEQGDPDGQNGYAWVLATSRFDRLRDGEVALEEALKATASERSAQRLDTLAAAFAETGDFEKAVSTQREAIAALTADEERLRAELNTHLDAYTKGTAWRE